MAAMRTRVGIVGLVAALLVLVCPQVLAAPAPSPTPTPTKAVGLPAPFSSWHVTVEKASDTHVRWITFDSAVLHRRATMRVVLPDAYTTATGKLPVVYYLHGTTRIGTDPAVDAVFDTLADQGLDVGYPFVEGGAHNEASYLATEADRIQFVAVSPDAGDTTWCEHCGWVDGRMGQGLDAESHLYKEVLPLTEAMFRVRTDRAGRGIMGASMGAAGALIQATRHPDLYSVVAALSPPVDYIYDTPYAEFIHFLYLREQGYPPAKVAPIATRAINPADLLSNLRGEGIDTVITMGEGCVLGAGQGLCQEYGFFDVPTNGAQEVLIRHNADTVVPQAIADGVPISYITYDGIHFNINHEVFNEHLLDRMNRAFAANAPAPASVTFRSADRSFSIWGWKVTLDRPNQEFVTVDARPDGRAFSIAGSGILHLVSAPQYLPGSGHAVTIEPGDASRRTIRHTVAADDDGRLRMTIDLGDRHPIDEIEVLSRAGVVKSPQTRVTVNS
jgi:hypothetical protein